MVERVTRENEIYLGGTYFPIVGQVRPSLVSTFPGKVVIGDYSLSDELLASNWVVNDQRGGILVEEMEEKIHQDRAYWSTCNLGFKGHIVLPALATDCGAGTTQAQVGYIAAGTGSVASGNVTPSYPTYNTKDTFALQVTIANKTDTPTTPTGWTALYAADTGDIGRQWIYTKLAAGTETGTLTVTTNSTDVCLGRIYSFRNVALASYNEGGSFAYATSTTVAIPSVTTSSTKRLAVAFVFLNGNIAIASATGETGGDWTEAVAEYKNVAGGCLQLQTATMVAAGTISGGTSTVSSVYWGVRAFALIPLAVPASPDARIIYEVGGSVYACFDNHLQVFNNTSDNFTTGEEVFPANPTDALVYRDATILAFDDTINIKQKLLPSLDKFIDNHYFKDWSGGYPTGWGFDIDTGASVSQNTDTDLIHEGKFSVKLVPLTNAGVFMRQKLPFSNVLRGKVVTVTAYGKLLGDTGTITVKDGTDTTSTNFDGTFQQKSVAHTMNAAATALEIQFNAEDASGTAYLYIDKVEISIAGFTDWTDMCQTGKYLTSLGDTIYMVDTNGKFYTSKVGIEYTEKCQIPDEFSTVTSLSTYRDASGNSAVYVGTDVGFFVYDSTNEELVKTELKLPSHPMGGVNPAHWREALYVPAGLDVLKYIAQSTASITSEGLSKDAGMPTEYQGEITGLYGGYNEIFALVDSTYGSGTVYSSIMSYDNLGWQCKWLSGTAGKAIKCALISDANSEYRLFFGTNNKVYHITLERNLRNPLKLSTYTFGASGVHISPWFDADWIGDKLALTHSLFCKDTTANETVGVSYRIDHATENIGSVGVEWTSLGTVVAAGDGVETEYTFASSVGLVFQSIQFRLDLVTTDSSVSPDVQWMKLKYLKLLDAKWGWAVTVDCSQEHKTLTPAELIAAVKTITAHSTLDEFTFRDSTGAHTHYAKVINASGAETTGKEWDGKYELRLIAP